MSSSTRTQFILVLVVGIVGSGVLNYWLTAAGFSILGSAVWVAGYGGMVVFIWYHWLRPLDMTGTSDIDESSSKTDNAMNAEESPE